MVISACDGVFLSFCFGRFGALLFDVLQLVRGYAVGRVFFQELPVDGFGFVQFAAFDEDVGNASPGAGFYALAFAVVVGEVVGYGGFKVGLRGVPVFAQGMEVAAFVVG